MGRIETQDSASAVLWAIGDPALGGRQFSDRWFGQGRLDDPEFVVGVSDPSSDWPRLHPGPLDAGSGFQNHSAVVVFEAPHGADQRWHVLELHALASNGPCPDLRVDINNHVALVLPLPSREDRAHAPNPPSPIAGIVDRTLAIPPGCVREGRNRLVLTTVAEEDPEAVELTRGHRPEVGMWFGSALTWTGLAFRTAENPPMPVVELVPTPLFVDGAHGRVDELVDLLVIGASNLRPARGTVTLAGYKVELDLGGYEFGDARSRFAVPEWSGPESAAVELQLGATTLSVNPTVRPARKWTVHLIPHVHLDIGYTDLQAKVTELHSHNIEVALDILRADPDYAFSVDGSFVVENYLRSRSTAGVELAVQALRTGRIGVNAFWALLLSGVASLEELYRALYFAAELRREHAVPMTYANLTDVPSYSWAIPSVLAAAGIETFMGLANHTRGGNADSDTLHLSSPVRWAGPDGASVVAFFADCYAQLRFICADPPTVAGCAQGLTRFLARYDRADYLPEDIPLVGTHSDNEDISHGYANLVGRWAARYAWPRLRFSTIGEYLHTVLPLRDELPVLRGDGGSYWEDGVGTQARAMMVHRRAQTLLPAAEALSALVAIAAPGLRPDLVALDEGWQCQLIGTEHTWTASHATVRPHSHQAVDQLDWKVSRIDRGHRVAVDEARRALSQLGSLLTASAVPSLLVWNPLSWTRDLDVDLELLENQRVIDLDGTPLPAENLSTVRDGAQWRRVRIRDVPAFGYRLLPLRVDDEGPDDPIEPVPASLETPHYEIRIDPESGRITGLRHRGLGRELIDRSRRWALGDVLYVSGGGTEHGRGLGEEATRLFDYDPTLPPADLDIVAASMRSERLRRTPWGWTLIATGEAPSLPTIRTEMRFYHESDRVDITIALDKEAVLAKESVYVAFPFAIDRPVVRYDRHQGWVDPAVDHHIGACNEWLTTQNAVSVSEGELSIIWTSADAPLFTMGDIVRGTWPQHFAASDSTILSWVMNNYWMTNTPAWQDGHLELRYAFQPANEFDPAAAARFGREVRTPGLVSSLTSHDRCDDEPRPLGPAGELLDVDLDDNVVATVYAGRHSADLIVRLQETAGRDGLARLVHPLPSSPTAWAALCTVVEDPTEPLALDAQGQVKVVLAANQVLTIALGR